MATDLHTPTRWATSTRRARLRCRHTWLAAVVIASAVAAAITVGPDAAQAQGADDAGQRLAERFAPVVVVREQGEECDTEGEPFEPTSVDIVLDNPEVFLRQVGNNDPVMMNAPGSSDIFDLREGWYLDFPGDALDPGCIFEEDFRRFSDGRSTVYAHVATEAGRPSQLALQYWFFWYHNPAKNNHEGDWEFIQLLFDVGTVEEALTSEPVSVGYAQHTGGERSSWHDPKLDRDGDRPFVYAAKGSHASYYGQALYLGRSGAEGFGCDNTDQPSRRLDADIVLLPDEVTDPDDDFAWLAFQGRWGQREAGFFNGPTGPYAKDRWTEPVTWSEGLRNASVVIPAGDRLGGGVLTSFCGIVEVGSSVLTVGLRSPQTLLVLIIVVTVALAVVSRRTRWTPVRTSPIRALRATGQILRCGLHVWRDHPTAMLAIGLVYIPVSIATSMVQVMILRLPLIDDLIELVGDRSGIAALLAIFVGGIGNLLAFTFVSSVVAATIDRPSESTVVVLRDAWTSGSLRRLVGAVARSSAIVIALLVSVVGIPWGIRQLVRYQMVPQVIALEDPLQDPLTRSSRLVRGSWWWTAGIIAIVQVTFAALGIVAALLVLLTVTSLPLWLFNVLSSVIFVVLVPVGAAAMAYVYGTLATHPDATPPSGTTSTAPPRAQSILAS